MADMLQAMQIMRRAREKMTDKLNPAIKRVCRAFLPNIPSNTQILQSDHVPDGGMVVLLSPKDYKRVMGVGAPYEIYDEKGVMERADHGD